MRKDAYRNFRIDARLADRAGKIAQALGHRSANAVIETCVAEMLDLVEQPPTQRFVPRLVLLVDEMRHHAGNPPRLSRIPRRSVRRRAAGA